MTNNYFCLPFYSGIAADDAYKMDLDLFVGNFVSSLKAYEDKANEKVGKKTNKQ